MVLPDRKDQSIEGYSSWGFLKQKRGKKSRQKSTPNQLGLELAPDFPTPDDNTNNTKSPTTKKRRKVSFDSTVDIIPPIAEEEINFGGTSRYCSTTYI